MQIPRLRRSVRSHARQWSRRVCRVSSDRAPVSTSLSAYLRKVIRHHEVDPPRRASSPEGPGFNLLSLILDNAIRQNQGATQPRPASRCDLQSRAKTLYANRRHSRLLRPRRDRPRRRAAEQRDEIAALHVHSITSSARASTEAGRSRPSAFAVLRLMTSSYLEACSTGRSAGFAPLRILST